MISEPDAVTPLSALDALLPLERNETADGTSESETESDDADDEIINENDGGGYFVTLGEVHQPPPEVWNRLHDASEYRNRKRDANYHLNNHRKEQQQLQEVRTPTKLSRPYQPDLSKKRYQTDHLKPEELYSFKPKVSEAANLVDGRGGKVWEALSKSKKCKDESQSIETPSRSHSSPRPSRKSSPLHNRLFDEKVGNLRYQPVDQCTFHPNVNKPVRRGSTTPRRVRQIDSNIFSRLSTPRPSTTAGSPGSPEAAISGRVSYSPKKRLHQTIDFRVNSSGCSIREEPSTESVRYKLLPKQFLIKIVKSSITRTASEGVWGETENGWIQIENSDGYKLLSPEVQMVIRRDSSITPTKNAIRLASTKRELEEQIDNLPNVYR